MQNDLELSLRGGYLGYHENRDIPFQPGNIVVIPKGTTVHSYDPKRRTRVTTRKQTVRVNHTMPGRSLTRMFASEFAKHSDWAALYRLICDEGDKMDCEDPRHRALRDMQYGFRIPVENPRVCWAGSGGWWSEVDVNDVLGIVASPALALNTQYDRLIEILRGNV